MKKKIEGRVFLLCVRKESENICERYKINLKEQDAQGKKSKQEKRLQKREGTRGPIQEFKEVHVGRR